MGKIIRRILGVALAAGSLVLVSNANATLTLSLSGDGGCSTGPIVSAGTSVGFIGACGSIFTANITGGISTGIPSLDLGTTTATSSTTGNLTITLTEDGLLSPTGLTHWLAVFTGSWTTANPGTSVSSIDTVAGTPLPTLTSMINAFNLSTSANIPGVVAPYSLTLVITIHSTGANSFSLDEQLQKAPEPASMALLGIALLGMGLIRRRSQS